MLLDTFVRMQEISVYIAMLLYAMLCCSTLLYDHPLHPIMALDTGTSGIDTVLAVPTDQGIVLLDKSSSSY